MSEQQVHFAMVAGPGEAAMAIDSLRRIRRLYPDSRIFLREDATTDGTREELEAVRDELGLDLSSNPTKNGYHGISRTLFSVLREVADATTGPGIVVKCDPDGVVATADAHRLAAHLAARPGIVGAVDVAPSGQPRDHRWSRERMLQDVRWPIGPKKTEKGLRVGYPWWRGAYRAAVANGYRPGTGVQAGVFAMSLDTVRALRDSGFLAGMDAPYPFLTYEEDYLLALGTKSVGHELHELWDVLDSWWVQYKPPVPLTPDEVAVRRPFAVHPLKNTPDGWALRASLP
ncbi:glycosyltransferase [Cellulomonas marina]|uniref:Glycosyl transferase family 2 n=1 Tax=Cellulomonas marina TaxID=988821 RepID=A0A1I0X1T7_9CELL|nr:glycosyltransferase [Cellulomonas marina]GIG29389.1 hypothetical protein Cma02nite_19890 [Cellulomonas marina]SFA94979.1 Glycosyl transferase family 2 [Cellulomonas marina]